MIQGGGDSNKVGKTGEAPGRRIAEQSKLFRDAAQKLGDAGELSPTEADEKFERTFRKIVPKRDDAD